AHSGRHLNGPAPGIDAVVENEAAQDEHANADEDVEVPRRAARHRHGFRSLYRRAAERFDAPLMTSTPQRAGFSGTSQRAHPEHSADLNLPPHSPLFSSSAQKENVLGVANERFPQDLIVKWSKKYTSLKKENDELKRAIRDKDHVIRQLTDAVRALQSEIDTSESQREKSTSTTSSDSKKQAPIGRVTPTKRRTINKSPRSPRSPRIIGRNSGQGHAARQLFGRRTHGHQPSSPPDTPDPLPRARQVLRESGIGRDVLVSSLSSATPPQNRGQADRRTVHSEPRGRTGRAERRPVIIRRDDRDRHRESEESDTTVATEDDTFIFEGSPRIDRPQSATTIPGGRRERGQTENRSFIRNQTYVIESLASSPSLRHPDWQNPKSPGHYLRLMRPEVIRRIDFRQSAIRTAAERRDNIEKMRREAARKLVKGEIGMDTAREVLYQDPTQIRAFSERDMKTLTRKNLASTTEYRHQRSENQKNLDKAANQILSYVYSQNTRYIRRSSSQPALH
ncbi:hypothetical protein WR25_24361, partial [Diploscapter pachys]